MSRTYRFIFLSSLLWLLPMVGCVLISNYLPLLAYLLMSPITFWVYKSDKQKAQKGAWRTSELTLHLLEVFGGWYGGFYAQQKIHHKNKKGSFQFVFWLIVALHLAAWLFLIREKL
jgi:uncharacterized membrane protein YsdA (DUF1294 family)